MARLIDADAVLAKIDERIKLVGLDTATKYGNETPEQADNSYQTWMKYEIADFVDDIRDEIVNAPTRAMMNNYVFDVISKAYERGYTVNIGSIDEGSPYCTCRVVVSDGHYKHARYIPGYARYPMELSEEYLPKLIDEMIDYIQELYMEDPRESD